MCIRDSASPESLYINPSHHNGRPIAGCQWSPDLTSDARANSTKTRPSSCQEGPAWYQPHTVLSNGWYSSNARRSSTGITMVMVFVHGNIWKHRFSRFSTYHPVADLTRRTDVGEICRDLWAIDARIWPALWFPRVLLVLNYPR